MAMLFYDAHNHLQDEWLAPHLDKVVGQLSRLGIGRSVVNGTREDDWQTVAELSAKHPWVLPSFGLHPWHVGQRSGEWFTRWTSMLDRHPAGAVGEIGIDRWILRARPGDPRLAGLRRAGLDEQAEIFLCQWKEAVRRTLPITVHCIDAWGPLWELVSTAPASPRGFLLHAYAGSEEMMHKFAAIGAYFSFNGYFLGERKEKQRRTFQAVPTERLLVETDAPAMPLPQAWRSHKLPPTPEGQPINHPGNIEAAYAGLASLRGVPAAELAEQVQQNFRRLFGQG